MIHRNLAVADSGLGQGRVMRHMPVDPGGRPRSSTDGSAVAPQLVVGSTHPTPQRVPPRDSHQIQCRLRRAALFDAVARQGESRVHQLAFGVAPLPGVHQTASGDTAGQVGSPNTVRE